MAIESLFNGTLTIYRLAAGTGMRKSYQVHGTARCSIQPFSRSDQQVELQSFGRIFKAFVSAHVDIIIGDKVLDETGQRYNVDGLAEKNYGNAGQHISLELTIDDSDNQDIDVSGYGQLVTSFFSNTLNIWRQQAGTGMRTRYIKIASTFGMIQSIAGADQQIDHESWGNTFRGYAQLASDIQPGDRITDELGNDYRVTGVQNLTFGSQPHRELLLSKDNATPIYSGNSTASGSAVGLLLALTQP